MPARPAGARPWGPAPGTWQCVPWEDSIPLTHQAPGGRDRWDSYSHLLLCLTDTAHLGLRPGECTIHFFLLVCRMDQSKGGFSSCQCTC